MPAVGDVLGNTSTATLAFVARLMCLELIRQRDFLQDAVAGASAQRREPGD